MMHMTVNPGKSVVVDRRDCHIRVSYKVSMAGLFHRVCPSATFRQTRDYKPVREADMMEKLYQRHLISLALIMFALIQNSLKADFAVMHFQDQISSLCKGFAACLPHG
jgi:hypothetical protein